MKELNRAFFAYCGVLKLKKCDLDICDYRNSSEFDQPLGFLLATRKLS